MNAFDGVRLELRRRAAGQNAPDVRNDEPVQVINATVVDVHNEAPSDPSVVNISVEGCAPSLDIFPGDSLEATLICVSAGAFTPTTTSAPRPPIA